MNIYISVTHAKTNIYILKLEKKEKEKNDYGVTT